ncbi:MAG: peptidylprolyl isomerase [Pseudohongiellaceae bacterium]
MNSQLGGIKQSTLLSSLLLLILTSYPAAAQEFEVTDKVTFETSMGAFEIELYGNAAPVTVDNFLKHVDGGYYDSAEFYRIVTEANDNGSPKIEVIQGGLNEGESPFPPIVHESTNLTGILHTDGVLSMARGAVGTASSEFFICIGDQPGLDFGQPRNEDGQGFAAFGKVISGMSVVKQINSISAEKSVGEGYTAGQVLIEPIEITKATRF